MMEVRDRNTEGEERKLPRNIRQMGEPGQERKILMEDYVSTYLHQMAQGDLTSMKTAILLGCQDGERIYIQGAVELDMGQEPEGWFANEHWRGIFQEAQTWFEGMDVVGWCLSNPGFPPTPSQEIAGLHIRNFPGDSFVLLLMDIMEKEEAFFLYQGQELVQAPGYYLYYEKNDAMQAYMSHRKGGVGIEPEGVFQDRAAARFRSVMQEKKERSSQKRMLGFLYVSSVMLILVVLVIGITLVNNYDRMADMESALYQISENLEQQEPQQTLETLSEAGESKETTEAQESQEPEENPEENPEEDPTPEEALPPAPEEPQQDTSQEADVPETYLVQKGDTLLKISRQYYGRDDMVEQICQLNQLENGDRIYFGQTILLP